MHAIPAITLAKLVPIKIHVILVIQISIEYKILIMVLIVYVPKAFTMTVWIINNVKHVILLA